MDERIPVDAEAYLKWKIEKQQRLRIVTVSVPAILGFLAIFYSSVIPEYRYPLYKFMLSLSGPLLLAVSFISILMIYLQTGFKKNPTGDIHYSLHESISKEYKSSGSESLPLASSGEKLEKIKEEISKIKEQLKKNNSIEEAISEKDRDELVEILKSDILASSKATISAEILNEIKNQLSKKNDREEIELVFLRTLERLNSETQALTRRGNLNLSLGGITAVIGLSFLGYFIINNAQPTSDKMAFITSFTPRLSLVILIEVFAYFFLKLYKSSLSEIKYFQNEMTNIESKLAAIKCSIVFPENPTTSALIKAIGFTERNAILKKGQTTTEIEKARIEHQSLATISEKISRSLNPNIKNEKEKSD
ncbi:hypothetical protein SMX40_003408 [Cronobacter turicensis]|nr:hypothetical protein [Cronobacter turicensis]ELY3628192.1 hypothetical protein [Cronobacter turicensis]